MTTAPINALDKKLLSGWQHGSHDDVCTVAFDGRDGAGASADASYRPGFGLFRFVLLFSLFLAALAWSPWSRAEAGSGFDMSAASYVYFSVPLNAVEPQFEKTNLRVDFKGAGLYILRLEMVQDTDEPRVLPRKGKYRNWRAHRTVVRTHKSQRSFELPPKPANTEASSAQIDTLSAKSTYLRLLDQYERAQSKAKKRALYPQLTAAYRRATANR